MHSRDSSQHYFFKVCSKCGYEEGIGNFKLK